MTSLEKPPEPLTAGIPTADAPNPLAVELERPWQEIQAQQAKQRADWQVTYTKKLDSALLNPDSLTFDFSKSADPEGTRKRALVATYLQVQNHGQPIPGDHLGMAIHRDRIAENKFQGQGKGDDLAFFDQIQGEALTRKQRVGLAENTRRIAVQTTLAQFFDPVRSGTKVQDWPTTLESLRAAPGYEPGTEHRYLELWNSVRQDIDQSTAAHRSKYIQLFNSISIEDEGKEDAYANDNAAYNTALETYQSFKDPQDRAEFIETLTLIADAFPEDRKAAFWNNLSRQSSRDMTDIGRNIARMEGSGKDIYGLGDFISIEGVTKTGLELRTEFAKGKAKRDAAKNFAEDIQKIRRQNFAPIQKKWGDGFWGDVESGIYATPGTVATIAAVAVPFIGPALTYKMLEGAAYSDMRGRLMSQGVTEDLASRTSEQLAGPIGALQFLPERLGLAAITRRIPVLEKVLTSVGNKITNRALRAVTSGLAVGSVELSTELLQNQIPNVVQDIVSELNTAIPGTDWEGEMEGFWSETVTTAVAILPLAVFGAAGGMSRDARAQAFAKSDPLARAAYGISPENSLAIDQAAAEGPASLNSAVEAALLNRDPNSESARDAVQEIAELTQAAREAAANPESNSLLPTIVHNSETGIFTLYDQESGQEIGQAPDADSAVKLAAAYNESVDLDNADHVAYLVTTLQGQVESAGFQPGRTITAEARLGETLPGAQAAFANPDQAERIAAQARRKERAEGGDGSITDVVFGQSITNKESLARRLRITVNRIQRGGSILTVFHEETHGFWSEAVASGRLNHSDALSFLQAIDTYGATLNTRSGDKARLIPANFSELSEVDQEVAIDEALSEWMEAEILRTRKGNSNRNLPPALVSKNLSAIARLAGDKNVGKFRSFIRAIREYFGLALDRAHILRKGLASGEIDGSNYDSFLNRLHGLTEQADLDQMARDAESAMLEGIIDPEDIPEGDPFSLGPSRLADLLRDDAASRIRNPEARAKALSRISRALEDVRLEAERLEVGSKRLRKSLQREAAVRQAMHFEELEDQAIARHSGILSDEDLAILTAQPIHSQMVSESRDSAGRTRKRGVLMSRAAAAKKNPDMFSRDSHGEYDDSAGMSPVIFGGTLAPHQMAQSLYDDGLIAEPSPDTMWEALRREQNSVETMRKALQSAKDDLRAARTTSQAEAQAWMDEQIRVQKINFSPKREILRASAMFDAILSALPSDLRGRIGGYTSLARLGSDETRLAFLLDRLARADRLLERHLRAKLNKEFQALLKRARPNKNKATKRPKGKIGADAHELFADLRDAMFLDAAETEAQVSYLENFAANPDITPEQATHLTLQANLTALVGDWKNADAARMEAALIESQRIYARGYIEQKSRNVRKSETRAAGRQALKLATGKSGNRPERVNKAISEAKLRNIPKQFLLSLFSFEQVVHTAFGDKAAEANSLVDWERRVSNAKHDGIINAQIRIERLFTDLAGGKFLGEQLRWEMSQPGSINVTDGLGNVQPFSELEAVTATLMWRQEDGRRHMVGHVDADGLPNGEWNYTQDMIDAIEDSLSDNAKAIRLYLAEQYAAEYDRLNAIYRELYGVSLPRHKYYSPIIVKILQARGGQTLDPVTNFPMNANAMSPGPLRTRSSSAIAEPDFRDALQTYLAHTAQMEHWMAYAPFVIEAQALLNNREVGNAIEAKGGKETLTVLRSWLDHWAQGGNRDAAAHLAMTKALNTMAGRAAAVALVGKISVLVMQGIQILAGVSQMPTGAFITRFAKLHTGQLNWGPALKSDFIRRRIEQQPPIVRQAMEGLSSAKPSRLKYSASKTGETIPGADALFTSGTYAMIYDYQLKLAKEQGLSGEEASTRAHSEAARSTERVAQPTRDATRSLYEVTATSPAARILWSFASDPRQKLALVAFSFSSHKTASERARALFVTWIAGGVVASLIRAAMRDILDDEDDEWFDERNWDPYRLALSSLTAPLAGIPFLGDALEGGVFKMAGQYLPEGNLLSVFGRGADAITNVPDWFTGDRELEDAIKDAGAILSGAGLFSGNAAAAASLSHVIRDLFRLIDNFTPDD